MKVKNGLKVTKYTTLNCFELTNRIKICPFVYKVIKNEITYCIIYKMLKTFNESYSPYKIIVTYGPFLYNRGMSVNILTAMNTRNNRRTVVSMRRPVNTPLKNVTTI
jgi:hypothetical protein